MEPNSWQVGDVKITQVIEIEDAGKIIQKVIPSATKENIAKIPWLKPHFTDENNVLKALVQAFVIETPVHRILVDPCVGNGKMRMNIPSWGNLQTDFLTRLEKQGFRRDSIDRVLCTHLHFDHVGWNTIKVNGTWVPTFPNTRYLFAKQEFDYWKTFPKKEINDDRKGVRDSVLPVFDAGLVDLISNNHSICEEVSLLPTPGHTPAHVSVLIKSQGKQAVITGDAVHHPCQMAHPEWYTLADTDKEKAMTSRRALFARFADTKTLIIGSHFAQPTAGFLKCEMQGFRLDT